MLANQACLALSHISLTLVVSALGLGAVRLPQLGEKLGSVFLLNLLEKAAHRNEGLSFIRLTLA